MMTFGAFYLMLSCSCFLVINATLCVEREIPNHFHWKSNEVYSCVLFCENCCKSKNPCYKREFSGNKTEVCCCRQSIPFWEFPLYTNTTNVLHGKLNMYNSSKSDTNTPLDNVYIYSQKNSSLNKLPSELCGYKPRVEINVCQNNFEEIPNLSCFDLLDKLNFSGNNLSSVKNTTFMNLKTLRVIDLSYNKIIYIEQGTFNYYPTSLHSVWLDGNRIAHIDMSNLVLGHIFSYMSFKYNGISKVTNNEHYWENINEIGSGTVDLRYNNITTVPDFQILQENGKIYSKVLLFAFKYPIRINHNPFTCDCNLVPFLEMMQLAKKHFRGSVEQVVCHQPPLFKGYDILTLTGSQLICNISLANKCPIRCRCIKQPSENRIVVNCSSLKLYKMLTIVPKGNSLHIDLSHNLITVLEMYKYILKTSWLDLSDNRITVIDPAIYGVKTLGFLNLTNNQIKTLDFTVQQKHPCQLSFGHLTLKCSCEYYWLKLWIERKGSKKCRGNRILCDTEDGTSDILLLSKDNFCGKKRHFFLNGLVVCLTVVVILFAFIFYTFQYEIFILFRKILLALNLICKNSPKTSQIDIYVSFDAENDDVRKWVLDVLLCYLEHLGYRVCLPLRDFELGKVHIDQIRLKISESKYYIVILTKNYLELPFQTIEWNQIWNLFKRSYSKNVIIINFDLIEMRDVSHRKLKAFLRLGYYLNFSDINKRLLKDVELMLKG